MKTTIVNASADIEELLGNLMVDILKLCVYVEPCILLHKLNHLFILLILNIITGKLVQAAFGDYWYHVLYISVNRQSSLVLNDIIFDFCDILIDWVIRLLIIYASFQSCHSFIVIWVTVIVQIAYSFQSIIELSAVIWTSGIHNAARLTALHSNN